MEYLAALETVRSLINGVNPLTQEELSNDSVYNHPQVIRALLTLIDSASAPKRKRSLEERQADNLTRGLPAKTGLPWTDEDRESAARSHQAGEAIEKIAEQHQRTKVGVAAELQRQGLISAEEAAGWGVVMRKRASDA